MAAPLPSREEIAACLRQQSGPVHAGTIAEHCGVQRQSFHRFLEVLEQYAAEGTIRRESGNRYRAARKRGGETWTGSLTVNQRGFGFVNASGKPDVFVPAEALGGALHGDTVVVETTSVAAKGTEGRVAEVVTRRNARVAGLIRKKRNTAWLEPDDPRVRGPIVLLDGFKDCKDGEAGVAKITRFPETLDENPEGELLVVLGMPGDPLVEVAKIMAREQIEEDHPAAAMQESEAMAAKLSKLKPAGREDLRHIPLLTIDPADARDHDDAVWAEKLDDGFRVYVAIADVSEYVQAGSALDAEAMRRGCTIYLPDRAIPMLPGALAADLCSLLPERERYCMCVIAELDENAKVKTYKVVEGLMRAAAMITYDGAAKTLGFTDRPKRSATAETFKKDLKVLATVTARMRRARMKRGALNLDLPEPKVTLGDTGAPESVSKRAGDPGIKKAYEIVEELMLLANELTARWLGKRKSPAIYRVHGKPDEKKLMRLGEVAESFGIDFDFDELQTPLGVSNWLKLIQKHENRAVLENVLLRSLKQAIYDIANIGHFGLASDAYVHFTSPIRRYPDLVVHRTIKSLIRDGNVEPTSGAIEDMRAAATRASIRERAAISVEREVVDLYRALYMRDKVGEIYEGTVNALVGGGLYMSVPEPFVDVMVRFESLGQDRYELSDDELSFIGSRSGDMIRLGDTVTIEIEDVSILRRTVYGRRIVFKSSSVSTPKNAFVKPGRRSKKSRAEPSEPARAEEQRRGVRGGTRRGEGSRRGEAKRGARVGESDARGKTGGGAKSSGRGSDGGRSGSRTAKAGARSGDDGSRSSGAARGGGRSSAGPRGGERGTDRKASKTLGPARSTKSSTKTGRRR